MRVLKFGGTSVGTAPSLRNVKSIIDSESGDLIIVVSALGGITDKLLKTAAMAEEGAGAYKEAFGEIEKRHYDLIAELFPDEAAQKSVSAQIEPLLGELKATFDGIYSLREVSSRTRCKVVSFGERMSSRIVTALLDGAKLYDSLSFIKTRHAAGKDKLDAEITEKLVKESFEGFENGSSIAVVPGFISTDAETGWIRNLGRGGSDYTASIIAAALDAESLEIWTDVDGFMTADPRIVKTASVIEELSFDEAMELCNFGAKVVYAPTLYPVCPKNIPIHIKNTLNPAAAGTVIRSHCDAFHEVTGLASIDNICLLTLAGASMAGVVGVDGRLFSALAKKDVSVFLVSQSSSETGISLGVGKDVAEIARKAVDEEFAEEIRRGAIRPVKIEENLATLAIVGSNLKRSSGIAGKLFTIMRRNCISVLACAQGSSEHNISMVIESGALKRALNVLHDCYFMPEKKELNLFICGVGTVGGTLVEQILCEQPALLSEHNLILNIIGISRSNRFIIDAEGIGADWKERLAAAPEDVPEHFKDSIIEMNLQNSVFVDCTASADIATLYEELLDKCVSVVAANKVAASSDYANYRKLKDIALQRDVKYLFETNVGAGLPVINTINALKNSGDHIEKIEAVLSGTLNYIFNTISGDVPFSETVRLAKVNGYSEPDPRIDLSGKDVIRKITILSREAGYRLNQEDVESRLLIPSEFFDCTMDEFWEKLPSLDASFEERRSKVEAEGKRWRFIARMEKGRCSAGLEEVSQDSPFYKLEGSNNVILLYSSRYSQHPMHIQGYGAGADVTAAGVFADIISIANI